MRRIFGFATLSSALVFALAGCSSSATGQDETATGPAQQDELTGQASEYTYFAISADLRKCPSPMCGGWFLHSLNRNKTICHDGRRATACYTPVIDWSEAKLSETLQTEFLDASYQGALSTGVYAIARGRFEPTNTTPRPELGRFVIDEAWVAQGETESDGVFARVWDNGVRCFAAPCPSVTEEVLNRRQTTNIMGIDWSPAALTDAQLETCVNAMSTPDGVVVAGYRYTWTENNTIAIGRTATAAYLRLLDTP